MQLHEIAKEIEKLPAETRESVLKFIEYKTDQNMEKVIAKIEGVQAEIKALEKDNNTIKWIIGIAFAILLAIIAFKH
ncbi:MAG: hypothetical protein QM528_08325 [Phycisphaerales bacterium]|nr:hypothetical protein [Phycisphaerales bacterium]